MGKGYTKMPQNIGNHLCNRRLDLKLEQKQVAQIIGVTPGIIGQWELGRSKPNSSRLPKIVHFLGYIPWDIDLKTLGGRIEKARLLKGLTMAEVAKIIGTTRIAVVQWEKNKYKPKPESLEKLKQLFNL